MIEYEYASVFIEYIDSDHKADEMVLMKNRSGLDFMFLDEYDEEIRYEDQDEAESFVSLFVHRVGWIDKHHA